MSDIHPLKQLDGHMNTFSGLKFSILDPKPEQIDIKDIGKGLCNTPHFGGQTKKFFSVAQHSIMVMDRVELELKPAALLHDGPEAYIGDCIKPLKVLLPDYQKIEKGIQSVMFKKFGLNPEDIKKIKAADIEVQQIEYNFFYKNIGNLTCWSPELSYIKFMEAARIYLKIKEK